MAAAGTVGGTVSSAMMLVGPRVSEFALRALGRLVLRFVNPAPSPVKVPLKIRLFALFVTTAPGSCASGTVPLDNCEAFRLFRPPPSPEMFPLSTLKPPEIRALALTVKPPRTSRLLPAVIVSRVCNVPASIVPASSC